MAEQVEVVSLNEALEIVARLRLGEYRRVLDRGGALAGCDYHCGCNNVLCGCRDSKTSHELEQMNPADFDRLRRQRIAELKAQLAVLEGGTGS